MRIRPRVCATASWTRMRWALPGDHLPPMDWDVVVVGGANSDHVVFGGALPEPGETVVGDSYLEGPGGKGLNQAVAAARLGARVAFVGRVGADARGDALRAALRDEGVDLRYLVVDPRSPTGAALVM